MNSYQVKVERDSACMGDDADAPHSYQFNLPRDATLNDVFTHLASRRYLASVAGKNHSWEAIVGEKPLAMIMANNHVPEASALLSNRISAYVTDEVLRLYFKYNSAAT